MTDLQSEFIDKLKTDRLALRTLKTLAVNAGAYEVAAKVRAVERETYPPTEETEKAEMLADNFIKAMELCGIEVGSKRTAYVSILVATAVKRNGGKFSVNDAAKIKMTANKLIG